jgi:tetratricopeptide (TPR) repeat protein
LARPLRYTAILVLVAACAALAAFGGWRFARASAPIHGPVVLISVDSLRADRLPVYGHTQGHTPAIDALAADGLIFDRAYANAPLTLPSHTSLLSGRLPFATGVRNNAGFVVDEGNRMLAEILRDRGYATGAVVSSFALRSATGINQGFTFFDDGASDAGQGVPQMDATGAWRDDAASEQIAERWLTATRSPRAFLFLHLFGPHRPRPTAGGAPYDAAVSDADEVVGRLVKYLKANQLYDQSTIILVSDHGEGLGDHGEEAHGLLVYDEALRVPFIVKPAASEHFGRRVADVVQLADIAPTVLDLARAPVPSDLEGRSLTPLIDGDDFPARVVYSESMYPHYAFGWSGLTTVTDGRFRYITPVGPEDAAVGAELFDHETDPREQTNLLGVSEPPALTTLRAALETLTSNPAMASPTAVPAEDHQRHEALGYVGGSAFARVPPTGASGNSRVHPRDKTRVLNTWREAVTKGLERDWTGALTSLKATLEMEPVNADLWAEVARFAVSAGLHDAALAALKKVDGLDPSPTVTSYLDARALQSRGRHQQAAAAFELALAAQAEPGARTIAGVRSGAAESLAKLYRYEEAEHLFLDEVRRFPHNARARAGLASLYQTTLRDDEAAVVLADLVHQIPTAEAHDLAARVWTALGQPKEAAAARVEARRLGQ